jgi:kynurenine formamidase
VLVVALIVTIASAACSPADDAASAGPEPPEAASQLLSGGDIELVDLTHPLSPDSIYWPTGSPFEHERLAWGINDSGFWYTSAAFSSPEHLGTHLDAPIHVGEGGWTNAEIPIERLFARGYVIDISAKAASDADATLDADDVSAWEQRHGPIAEGSVVIVRTGWASRWPDWNAYYGTETPEDVSTLRFPGVSEDGARALLSRGIAGLGIDTASIDPGRSSAFEAHRVLAAGNVYNLENLTNVASLPETGFEIIALPMKIGGGTGAPTRVVAVLPR